MVIEWLLLRFLASRWGGDAIVDGGDEMKDGAQAEGGESYRKQAVTAADQGQNSVEQAQGIEGSGDAQPENALSAMKLRQDGV